MATTVDTRETSVTIQRLTNVAALSPLRAQWNALARGVPFRSYEWLESWWRTYGGGQKHLLVLAVHDDAGELMGLAPWFVEPGFGGQRVIQFLGSGEVCSDYLTVLCRPGGESRVAQALAEWLLRPTDDEFDAPRWTTMKLGSVNEHDAVLARLVDRLNQQGLLVCRRNRPSCWRVNLPDCWEDYLHTLSKSHRKQIRRLDRQYFDTRRAHLHTAQTPQQVEYGLEVLRRLHQRRRESLGQSGCFSSSRFATFHAQIAQRLLRSGQLRLVWLDVDGRTVAAEYQVLGDGVVYAYQSGIEPSALRHEPGRLITLAMLKLAINEGRHAYDFLRGDEQYKAHWRALPRPTHEVRIAVDSPIARLRQKAWWASGVLKGWLNREQRQSLARAKFAWLSSGEVRRKGTEACRETEWSPEACPEVGLDE